MMRSNQAFIWQQCNADTATVKLVLFKNVADEIILFLVSNQVTKIQYTIRNVQ